MSRREISKARLGTVSPLSRLVQKAKSRQERRAAADFTTKLNIWPSSVSYVLNSSRACLTVRFTDVCFPEVRNRKQTESGLPNRAPDSAKNEWHVQQNDLRANLDLGIYSGLVRACCTLQGQVWVWKTPGANSAALSLFKQPARTEKPVARSLHVVLIFLQLRSRRHRLKHFFWSLIETYDAYQNRRRCWRPLKRCSNTQYVAKGLFGVPPL